MRGGIRPTLSIVTNVAIVLSLSLAGPVPGFGEEEQPSGSAWEALRASFYGDAEMGLVDEAFMSLEVSRVTPDPAATPLTLRFAADERRRIRRVRVFIDNNPSPLVATFDLGAAPVTEIDLRVRIDRFTSVRAIAETADGRLEMRSAWVKASGGCSAPPSGPAGPGMLGQIRLRPSPDAKSWQMIIRHPNSSGFQIDPRTGDSIPAHYISHISMTAGGKSLLEADTGISLSENPSLGITSGSPLAAPVTVTAVDSQTKALYTATWQGGGSVAANGGG
jgi:sulfur-oxidizing protein SoxY